MYLRRSTKRRGGAEYESWLLVESVRTARGPRQRVVASIGKLPGLDRGERVGWEEIGRLLSGRPEPTPELFTAPAELPSWATVDIKGVRVERLRSFGDVYLGLLLWNKLGLGEFCREHLPAGREEIPWSIMAALLVLARFCAPSSELAIAETWYGKTALDDLLGIPEDKVNDDRLYRALDALLPHKEALCRHLQRRYGELFGATFDFLFYDITSTYFEGMATGNPQARRGYSRDGRPDCSQVCIGLVATREGLPVAFEIFDGNRSDVTTTQDMVRIMESRYGKANRVWVMDRGMVSERNLAFMRASGARYLVGTPKSMLRRFEQHLLGKDWEEVRPGVDVKLCRLPDGTEDTFLLCRSAGRKEKENAILNRFVTSLEAKLTDLARHARSGKGGDKQKSERRIGRLLERHSRAAALFTVTVTDVGQGKENRIRIDITKDEERYQWALATGGSYLLRTNWAEGRPAEVWNTYIRLTEVEDCFRSTKHDLGLRPIFHHTQDRTHAHILVCFLALTLWRTLQQWMNASGLGSAPRHLLGELRDVKSLDVLLPTRKTTIRLRTVATPPKELKVLLQRMKILLPNKPKILGNVVTKPAPSYSYLVDLPTLTP
jgi:transposase